MSISNVSQFQPWEQFQTHWQDWLLIQGENAQLFVLSCYWNIECHSIFTMCILYIKCCWLLVKHLTFVSVCGDGQPARWSAQCPRWVQWCSQWSSWQEGWLQEALWWVSFRDHCACDEQDQEVNVNVKSLLTSYKVECNNW